ncbi:tol-pal system protein YbgF [Azohydromonas caseinilytica]|uniref:Cell division coordinator CpoB n=1 Tax=Azohydromonas caseinilytica TaxID=2728836 RepID=A0A848F8Y6_9BURK|nr:tol-pal system protein YbgF [Azohydromonas caseinilytica]NML14710.1 tol-pal system protein YbgF [Azohydromonas caseinilytica]
MRAPRFLALAAALALALPAARAEIFPDNEARRAILELRKQVEDAAKAQKALDAQMQEELTQLRRSLVDLNNQIETQRAEMATLRGSNEQLTRDVAELQRRQKDIAQGVDERMRKLEPQKVSLDGQEFTADVDEKRQYDEAVALLRNADFAGAANAFGAFLKRWPQSGYAPSARFWLGNAQYGKRDYKEAIATFRAFVNASPQHPRAAEALLAAANAQVEAKDTRAARATLNELVKNYPQSEAAVAGRERLAVLK